NVLGITDVDPIKYGLIFERFINPDRFSLPDIDIDVPDGDRDEIKRRLSSKYQNIYGIITFDSLQLKSALQRVVSYLKMPPKDYFSISERIFDKYGALVPGYEDSL